MVDQGGVIDFYELAHSSLENSISPAENPKKMLKIQTFQSREEKLPLQFPTEIPEKDTGKCRMFTIPCYSLLRIERQELFSFALICSYMLHSARPTWSKSLRARIQFQKKIETMFSRRFTTSSIKIEKQKIRATEHFSGLFWALS